MKAALLFLVAALLTLSFAAAVSHTYYPINRTSVDLAVGQRIFEYNCASCHSTSADQAGGIGPTLANIANVAASRVEGLNAEEYLLQSILYPAAYKSAGTQGAMPASIGASLSNTELSILIAYLMDQEDKMNIEKIEALDMTRPVLPEEKSKSATWQDLVRGQQLFSEKLGCASCHDILHIPGADLAAPSLHNASRLDESYIRESISNPSAIIVDTYKIAEIETTENVVYSARVLSENSELIEILTGLPENPMRVKIPAQKVAKLTLGTQSIMPPYSLPPEDEAALIAFLKFLGSE